MVTIFVSCVMTEHILIFSYKKSFRYTNSKDRTKQALKHLLHMTMKDDIEVPTSKFLKNGRIAFQVEIPSFNIIL